eukprot:1298372-Rhodomonas_salina.5
MTAVHSTNDHLLQGHSTSRFSELIPPTNDYNCIQHHHTHSLGDVCYCRTLKPPVGSYASARRCPVLT